jgi:large subunit ribosomal protein L4
MKVAALRGALSDRARHGRIHVVSSLVSATVPSTQGAIKALARLSDRKNVLVVLDRADIATWKSLRNADRVHLLVSDQLNTYDVLRSDDVVFTERALELFLAGPATGRSVTAVATEHEAELATGDVRDEQPADNEEGAS